MRVIAFLVLCLGMLSTVTMAQACTCTQPCGRKGGAVCICDSGGQNAPCYPRCGCPHGSHGVCDVSDVLLLLHKHIMDWYGLLAGVKLSDEGIYEGETHVWLSKVSFPRRMVFDVHVKPGQVALQFATLSNKSRDGLEFCPSYWMA